MTRGGGGGLYEQRLIVPERRRINTPGYRCVIATTLREYEPMYVDEAHTSYLSSLTVSSCNAYVYKR